METQTKFQNLPELKHLPVNEVKPFQYDIVFKQSSLIEKKIWLIRFLFAQCFTAWVLLDVFVDFVVWSKH